MAKKEVKTDLWVARQLDKCGIQYTPQGSDVKEIGDALSSASKRGTGKAGFPEYVAVVNDFVIVIEDKADMGQHIKLTDSGIVDTSTKAVTDFAVNGAYFYAKHIAQNSSFGKVFAIGVSGDSKHHKITPLYVDDRESYKRLPDVESFAMFTEQNIQEYYVRNVLEEKTDIEKTTEEILKDAAELHEFLRTYGSLKDQDKPLVVSGILLALDDKFFSVDSLKGDGITTDGQLICEAIQRRLKSSNVGPDAKRDKLMSEFAIIRTSARLNERDEKLGKTPLKFYTEFLKERVFDSIKYKSSAEDFIGRFYGEFMSYSGGDGQSLGIILTPAHICELFCDLLDVQPTDIVLDIKTPRLMHIMLPINEAGNPDYQFMEDYIRELMDRKYKQYQDYVQKQMTALVDGCYVNRGVDPLKISKWKAFSISDIFEIKPGKRLVAADTTEGRRPFIGALDNNNGVARFVSDKNTSLDKNVLGVNYNGNGMVIGFYHPYECIFSDDVKRFHLKHHEDNQFVLLFMKVCILMQKQKFGYLYKFNAERMAHTSIMLPIAKDGTPDYAFMESYGKLMFLRKYLQYLSALKKRACYPSR